MILTQHSNQTYLKKRPTQWFVLRILRICLRFVFERCCRTLSRSVCSLKQEKDWRFLTLFPFLDDMSIVQRLRAPQTIEGRTHKLSRPNYDCVNSRVLRRVNVYEKRVASLVLFGCDKALTFIHRKLTCNNIKEAHPAEEVKIFSLCSCICKN